MKANYFKIALILSIILILSSCCSTKESKSKSNHPEIMELYGKYEQLNENMAKFILKAKRLATVDREYIPNSDVFRVNVFDQNGNLIWDSSFENNYLQVITNVEPVNVGDEHTYELHWNFSINNSKSKAKPGNYTALLMIPSKPNIYSCKIDFEIE